MADYKSTYTGAQIDGGIAKALTALQELPTHTHTAAAVGAALAGYGYGGEVVNAGGMFADESALNSALDALLGTMVNNEAKQIRFSISAVEDIPIGDLTWKGVLYKSSANYATLTAESTFGNRVTVITKAKAGGSWQPWEWVNPPMALDKEYRTTERWNGAAVYTKVIGLGEATDGKGIEWGVTKSKLLSVNVVLDTYPLRQRTAGEDATGSTYYATYYVVGASITIFCGTSIAGKPVYAHIRYIK